MPKDLLKWRISKPEKNTVSIEGIEEEIPNIIKALSAILSAGADGENVYVLKVSGLSLTKLKHFYYELERVCLDEVYPVQAQFDAGLGKYVVTQSGMSDRFPVGSLLP